MIIKKIVLPAIVMMVFGFSANAQLFKTKAQKAAQKTEAAKESPATESKAEETTATSDTTSKSAPTKEQIKADHFLGYDGKGALAINISTIGIGVEYAHNINRHLNGRIRLNLLQISNFEQAMELGGAPTFVTANIDIFNTDLLLEYLPFRRKNFKLVVGGSFITSGKADVNVAYNEAIKYGDIIIEPEEIGDMTIGIDYAGFAPYMGLGWGRAVPRKNVGFGIEIGTYYVGSPDVSLAATNMLADTSQEEGQLQENMNDYKWFPFLNLRLAFRL